MIDFSSFFEIDLTRREKKAGCCYLTVQTVLLPHLLKLFNGLLPVPLSMADLNFFYFLLNFCAMVLIFRSYLKAVLLRLPQDIGTAVLVAIPIFLVYWLVNMIVAHLFLAIDPDFANWNDSNVGRLTRDNFLLMFVGTVFLVPVTEEVFHRGLIFRGLYSRSPALAWVASVLLFSMIHVMGYLGRGSFLTFLLCFFQYIPAGVCLAAAYRLSGSILAPIFIHALSNLLGMLSLR